MKKTAKILITITLFLMLCTVLMACGDTDTHVHTTKTVTENAVEATCLTGGAYDEVVKCTECGKEISRTNKTTEKASHTGGEPITENESAATCTLDGSYEEVVYCLICNAELSRVENVIKASHNYTNDVCTLCGKARVSEGLVFVSNGDGTCYVDGIGTCTDIDIIIPEFSPEGDKVTKIAARSFIFCQDLVSLKTGNSVEVIEKEAFLNCYGLTSVVLGTNVKAIEDYAFTSLKLVEIYNLSSLELKKGSRDNGNVALFAVDIYSSTEEKSKRSVSEDGYIYYFYSEEYGYVMLGYIGNETALVLPEKYNENNYDIYNCAFMYNDRIKSVVIPGTIDTIGAFAFQGCENLLSVAIANARISTQAFYACSSLTSVTLGYGVDYIARDAFISCSRLTEIINHSSLPITVGESSYGRIAKNAIEVHTADSKVVTKGDFLFYTYEGENYLINYIGESETVTLPESYNGENYKILNAFSSNIKISKVTISNGITHICKNAFANSLITSILIPESVIYIDEEAFEGCIKLIEVINHSELDIVKGSTDNGCVAYYALTVHNDKTQIVNQSDYLFITYEGTHYLIGCSGNDSHITLPDYYKGEGYKIYECAFYNPIIRRITIPNTVLAIDSNSFPWGTLNGVYFKGTEAEWNNIAHFSSSNERLYFYSETKPEGEGDLWHYDTNGKPVAW